MTPSQPVQSEREKIAQVEVCPFMTLRTALMRGLRGKHYEGEAPPPQMVDAALDAILAALPSPDPRAVRDAALEEAASQLEKLADGLETEYPSKGPTEFSRNIITAQRFRRAASEIRALRSTPAPAQDVEEIARIIARGMSDNIVEPDQIERAIIAKLNASDTKGGE
jgi:hypothetical protein